MERAQTDKERKSTYKGWKDQDGWRISEKTEERFGSILGACRGKEKHIQGKFYQLTESMKSCTGEFFVTFSDILMGGPFKFAHETIENVSVEEAVIFLLKCINDNLVSFVSPLESLESLPFSWDVKEKNGKKLALLDIGCGKPTFIMAQYGFYIAEI